MFEVGILKTLWDYRRAVIPGLLFAALIIAISVAKYNGIEKDAAVLARGVAENTLDSTRRVSAAKIGAMQSTMEDADERQQFLQKTEISINQGRLAGDGPLAPVLRDALGRLRQRQASRHLRH